MPSIEQNLEAWDREYTWAAEGDEWSREWGGAAAQWHGSLLPRLRHLLPVATILEIAPGFGRWTQFLAPLCQRLIVVDLSASCIDACKERFASLDHLEYHVNNGSSLEMVSDGSIDLAFSFDSLVHVEDDVIAAYMHELRRTLGVDGAAFIHHSNAAEYRERFVVEAALPDDERQRLEQGGRLPPRHWRALSMSADRFAELAEAAGLRCVGQELINWGGERLIDSISVVTQPGSRFDRSRVIRRNQDFMAEARSIRAAREVHGTSSSPSAGSLVARDLATGG